MARRKRKPFHLFVYGTLMDPAVFRAVTGRQFVMQSDKAGHPGTLVAREAVLDGYKKISPDNTYLYAVPAPHGRIRGLLIGPLEYHILRALRQYEGDNYRRRTREVYTSSGTIRAVVFVAHEEKVDYSFGHEFRDELKQEVLLDRKIEAALLETEREKLHTTEKTARRAVGELRGSTIRDLRRHHFEVGGISDYAIRHSIKDDPLRDFSGITEDNQARVLAPNYLIMVMRQVIFNQFEERIRRDMRYELDHMGLSKRYYDRTISSLVALRMLNNSQGLLGMLAGDILTDLDFQADHLVDFVRWSIIAADAIYESAEAKRELNFIRTHMGTGAISLGTELEFSNIGHEVIDDPSGQVMQDPQYDGFFYFPDFGLDVLTWKLGGHVDDHHTKLSQRQRRGFFEVAPGNLSLQANLSKPITDDPWLLNQFIHQTRRFFDIQPHSVHISMQLKSQQHNPVIDRLPDLAIFKCLFAIAGELHRRPDGEYRINRLATDEIIGCAPGGAHMLFSEIRKRYSQTSDELYPATTGQRTGTYVQQFRFLRLSADLNYEPIVMALKGVQISLRPGSFLTAQQYTESARHRERFEQLIEWGAHPSPVTESEADVFLTAVHKGLMREKRGRPAHSEAYIAWAISELREQLLEFNRKLNEARMPGPTS